MKKFMITAFLAATVLCLLTISAKSSRTSFADRPTEEIYINRGDTLWALGRKYCSDNDDVREWISAVIKLNNMSSGNICAGQVITVYTGVSE